MGKHTEENWVAPGENQGQNLANDEMRAGFRSLHHTAKARLKAGASPVFAKIVAHVSACLGALDKIDETLKKGADAEKKKSSESESDSKSKSETKSETKPAPEKDSGSD